jgi:NAD(P) transhydrogenase subunit alpha
VLILGVGVAGLQAIATARRLGAVVSAYDLRPAVKEQVQSLGARFVELPIEAKDAQDARGYATAQGEEFYRRQRDLLGKVIAENDVVITAAVIPGKKAPVLVTKEMVAGMAPGSVLVDLAAERGGNCELTRAGETFIAHGVTLIGLFNLASTVPYHASQMYAKNVTTFLLLLVKEGKLQRRNHPRNASHTGRRSGQRPPARIFLHARFGDEGSLINEAAKEATINEAGPAQQPVRLHAGGVYRF